MPDSMVFFSNLRPATLDPHNPITLKREAYLLSETEISHDSLARLQVARQAKKAIMADNGFYSRIKQLIRASVEERNALANLDSVATDENRQQLHETVSSRVQLYQQSLDLNKVLENQLSLEPNFLVCPEDMELPVFIGVGFSKDQQWNPKQWLSAQRRSVQMAVETFETLRQRESTVQPFAVLHAYDFDSAYQGARLYGETHKTHSLALGLGAVIQRSDYISSVKFADQKIDFEQPLPARYIISTLVVLGAIAGFKSANEQLPNLHLLGVSTPIFLILFALASIDCQNISTDSSAPVMAAETGKIFTNRPPYLKANRVKLVKRMLESEANWSCNCPFCAQFEQNHPSQFEEALTEWNRKDSLRDLTKLRISLIQPNTLANSLPLFSTTSISNMANELLAAHSGHNYWVLKEIIEQIVSLRHSKELQREWLIRQCQEYIQLASLPKYAESVDWCLRMIDQIQHR